MEETISIFTINVNQETTQQFTYKKETVPEIKDIKELPDGISLLFWNWFTIINGKTPWLKSKYNMGTDHKSYYFVDKIIPFLNWKHVRIRLLFRKNYKVTYTLVPYVSTSSRDGYNGGYYLPIFNWTNIIKSVWKERTNIDTCLPFDFG